MQPGFKLLEYNIDAIDDMPRPAKKDPRTTTTGSKPPAKVEKPTFDPHLTEKLNALRKWGNVTIQSDLR